MPKTLICIPCMDTFPTGTVKSIVSLQKYDDTAFAWAQGTLIHIAREQLADAAMNAMPEDGWTLWLDSDMTFPPDTLKRMIETAEQNRFKMLSAVYYRRKPPYTPVLFEKLDIDYETGLCKAADTMAHYPDEIFETQGVGFGCFLVHTQVFRMVRQKFGNCFVPIGLNSEDTSFCWKARQCGYKIMADSGLNVGHVGQFVYGKETLKHAKQT